VITNVLGQSRRSATNSCRQHRQAGPSAPIRPMPRL